MPATRITKAHLYIDWNRDGVFTDETDRLISANGTWRRNNPEDSITSPRGIVSQATITLINHDQRFSTLNLAGPLVASLSFGGYYQAPIYLTVEEQGVETRIFTGVIKGPREQGGNLDEVAQITFDCRSREELLIQQKLSTTLADLSAYHEAGYSEAWLIRLWLLDAGVDAADLLLDPGNFVVPWAWLDNESPLEDIWQLAAAGGGAFFTNPDGEFVYENMSKWIDALETTDYEAFTNDDYKGGSIRVNDDELYETVVVEVASRQVVGSAIVWESKEQISVPASTSKVVVVNLQQPLVELDAIIYSAAASSGLNMASSVTHGTADYAQRIEITFINAHTTKEAQIYKLRIYGKALDGGLVTEVKEVSADSFWSGRSGRTRNVTNVYIQTQSQGEALAEFLIYRHQKPRVFYTLTGCPGKTSRQLTQRIVIRAGQLVSADRPALITGITWNWSLATGFIQTIEAFDCKDLFPYTVTNTTPGGSMFAPEKYFRIGTSLLTNSASFFGDHRVFY